MQEAAAVAETIRIRAHILLRETQSLLHQRGQILVQRTRGAITMALEPMMQATAEAEDIITTIQEVVAGEVVATRAVEEEEEILEVVVAEVTLEEEAAAGSSKRCALSHETESRDHESLTLVSAGNEMKRLNWFGR